MSYPGPCIRFLEIPTERNGRLYGKEMIMKAWSEVPDWDGEYHNEPPIDFSSPEWTDVEL
ncbi:MAG: hypothetical protein IJH65_15320 [Methanobrevibacter sp.]|nr:hypothetical protein [Methanobrevibacter sp.]